MREINSLVLGQLVEEGIADIYLINNRGELILFTDDVDIAETKVIGCGQQGKIYAVVVIVVISNDDHEERRLCVLKELGQFHESTPPFERHAEITAEETSSIDDNIIKLMAIRERKIPDESIIQRFALLPFCGLFLDDITRALPEHSKKNPTIEPIIVLHATIDLLIAIQSMHNRGFVHGDIKGANIAYYLGHLCLIDLDCALKIDQKVLGFVGSPLFVHPACFIDSDFCAKPQNDIYALGIVLKLLLHDKATINWMRKWEAMKEQVGGLSIIREVGREQSEKFWKHTNEANKSKETLLSLSMGLIGQRSQIGKLRYIADRMTSIFPEYQPTVEELLACCEEIKQNLLLVYSKFGTLEEQERELRDFYESLMPKEFLLMLDPSISTPINEKSVSRMSFFSEANNARNRYSLDGSARLSLKSYQEMVSLDTSQQDLFDKSPGTAALSR